MTEKDAGKEPAIKTKTKATKVIDIRSVYSEELDKEVPVYESKRLKG